jgi:hypothetical protein
MKRLKVLVLGCGPAGLFAAHAANFLGAHVDIMSKRRRSEMFGAQYLHTDIPGLTDDQRPFAVEYRLTGTLDEYLHKVYGEKIPDPGKITVESLIGSYPAWDIRRAYLRAWDLYGSSIQNVEGIDARYMGQLIFARRWDAIISTIPAKDLCFRKDDHSFPVRNIWAIGDAPERGIFAPDYVGESNVILYDGSPNEHWYRASSIAGYNAVEWPSQGLSSAGLERLSRDNASLVAKPIGTNCNCWVEGLLHNNLSLGEHYAEVFRVGRYGAWDRKGHTHQAYWRTLDVLTEVMRVKELSGA